MTPAGPATKTAACICTWQRTIAGYVRLLGPAPCAWHPPVDVLEEIRRLLAAQERSLADLIRKVGHMTSQQDELNADVAQLTGAIGTIQQAEQDNATAVAAVQAEVDSLKQAQPDLDLSGLEAAINGSPDGSTPGLTQAAAAVTAGVQAVQGLVPAEPADPSA